jgi:replicative DNA helicase
MAKRLDVPVVALAQINREVERQGEDKRPQLSHIKQSGAIAEDARLVVLLYRPEYYYRAPMEHEDVEQRGEREAKLRKVQHQLYWIVAKNSNGPQGQVLTFCQAECSAIRGWSYDR